MIARNLKTLTLLVPLLFILANVTSVTSLADNPVPGAGELNEDNAEIAILQWVDTEGRQPITYEEYQQGLPPGKPLAIDQSHVTFLVPPSESGPPAPLVLVIVNSFIQPSIQDSLEQYVLDLENEGYSVNIIATSGGMPSDLKEYLQSQMGNGLVGCLLVGDLPVPWYEMDDDFHGYAQFPIDLYYMDLDGTWADSDGDGLYDGHSDGEGDRYPDIWVGRLSASTLTGDEAALLQNYFEKNHSYRTGDITLNKRALVYVDDDWINWADTWGENVGLAYDTRTLVKDGATTIASDYRDRLDDNYEWIQLAAHSSATAHGFKIGDEWSEDFITYADIQSIDPVALFYNLFACSNCRYVESDYIGGWYIFANTYGLAAVGSTKIGSMLSFEKFYTPLGQHKNLGESFKEWFIAVGPYDLNDRRWYYGMTLLGDPTLTSNNQAQPPLVTTDDATSVGADAATLNGTIVDDGGEVCQYRFEYGDEPGEPYAHSTAWTGSKNTGQSFSETINGLSSGITYYFRAQSRNNAGISSGSELTFITAMEEIISFTVTDYSNNGVQFGTVDPGQENQPADWGDSQGAVTFTVGSETNVAVNVQLKGTDFTGPDTINISNVKYNDADNPAGANPLITTYVTWFTVAPPLTGDNVTQIYMWISIPEGQAPGTYTSIFYFQAIKLE